MREVKQKMVYQNRRRCKMRKRPTFVVAGIILMLLAAEILFAEMTVEDPRVIGKGKFIFEEKR